MALATHYVQTAAALLEGYNGGTPFAPVLKEFFAQHKKYGSRDRKAISQLCYSFFRLGKALPSLPIEERILLATFYCSRQPNAVLQQLRPGWDATLSLFEKMRITSPAIHAGDIFPWVGKLGAGMDADRFAFSHLQQPQLFLRIRPGFKNSVLQKLDKAGIAYTLSGDNTLALPNATTIEPLLQVNKEVVVQDFSSQQTGKIAKDIINSAAPGKSANKVLWDCCAASGGKSIMMHDLFPGIQLTVSDIRPSILHNLKKRFDQASIKNFHSFVADLSQGGKLPQQPFKRLPANSQAFLLADVPCTGSGTWARTPEQLYFFNEKAIADYAGMQFSIADNALQYLPAGGFLIYITCSVFAMENEGVVHRLLEKHPLELLHGGGIDGTAHQADSMYLAVMRKY